MHQQITIAGYLGKDTEMRFTESGIPVASFNVATSKHWTGNDGQRQEKTTWFRVTAWRKLAEIASEHLRQGDPVLVVGEIEEARAYIDRDGNPRASIEVTANNIRFLPNGKNNGNGDNGGNRSSGSKRTAAPVDGGVPEDEIPF